MPVSPYAGTLFTAGAPASPYAGTLFTTRSSPFVDKGPVYSGISALRASTASPFSFTGVLVASGPL